MNKKANKIYLNYLHGGIGLREESTVCLRKNDTALACYNFHVHQPTLILFGRNVAKKASSQMVLYFPTSPN